jgi:hypothetical protein
MRVLAIAVLGALLTIAVAGAAEAQHVQMQVRGADAARVITGTKRGMTKAGTFSFKSKPYVRPSAGAPAAPSSSAPADVWRISMEDRPMSVPTYLLPNGVLLQATHGMHTDDGVSCIAYCQLSAVPKQSGIPELHAAPRQRSGIPASRQP